MAKISTINYGLNMQLLQQKTLVQPLGACQYKNAGGGWRRHLPGDEWANCQDQNHENLSMLHQDALDLGLIRCEGSR